MSSIAHLFADLTTAIEDAHGVAVEGQRSDVTAEEAIALVHAADTAVRRQTAIIRNIEKSVASHHHG